MPKTSTKTTTSKLRFAPYMPMHGQKVLSQLHEQDDQVLREAVEALGGTVVGIKHGLDYIVALKKENNEFCLSDAVDDFTWRNAYLQERLISREDMFARLNKMMAATMPARCNTITFRDVVYPIRAEQYTELGETMEFPAEHLACLPDAKLAYKPELDIVMLRYQHKEKDMWKMSSLIRYQICKNESNSMYVLPSVSIGLFAAVHDGDLFRLAMRLDGQGYWTHNLSERTMKHEFETLEEAKTYVSANFTQPLLKVNCDGLAAKLKVKDSSNYFTEVLHVWTPANVQ